METDWSGLGFRLPCPTSPSAALRRLRELVEAAVSFEKMVQKIVISSNCLQFPEIPAKIREIFTEKSAISVDLQQKLNLEKMIKNLKNLQKSPKVAEI